MLDSFLKEHKEKKCLHYKLNFNETLTSRTTRGKLVIQMAIPPEALKIIPLLPNLKSFHSSSTLIISQLQAALPVWAHTFDTFIRADHDTYRQPSFAAVHTLTSFPSLQNLYSITSSPLNTIQKPRTAAPLVVLSLTFAQHKHPLPGWVCVCNPNATSNIQTPFEITKILINFTKVRTKYAWKCSSAQEKRP